jgi:PKD domain
MRHLYMTNKTKEALRRKGKMSRRRVAGEQQRWILKGMWFLPTVMCLALVAGFPWQAQAQTPCPRASQCIPDGVFTVTFSVSGDPAGCVFNATVNWGDGVIDTVANIVDGQTVTHTYDAPGTYTVYITGGGTPTSPNDICTFNPHTIVTVQTHVQGAW